MADCGSRARHSLDVTDLCGLFASPLTGPIPSLFWRCSSVILGPVAILSTPTDIFPNINIPVIAVAWTYTGLNAEDVETRLTTPYEKVLTDTC